VAAVGGVFFGAFRASVAAGRAGPAFAAGAFAAALAGAFVRAFAGAFTAAPAVAARTGAAFVAAFVAGFAAPLDVGFAPPFRSVAGATALAGAFLVGFLVAMVPARKGRRSRRVKRHRGARPPSGCPASGTPANVPAGASPS
jgi:hypothetical protein